MSAADYILIAWYGLLARLTGRFPRRAQILFLERAIARSEPLIQEAWEQFCRCPTRTSAEWNQLKDKQHRRQIWLEVLRIKQKEERG